MKLRTQLILAFILLAVIPLSGLTVYSYLTSLNAFKKAAEAGAMEFSSELESRFDRVVQVINEEVDNVLRLHYDDLVASDHNQLSQDTEEAISRFRTDIESVAPYIRSLEIAVPGKEQAGGSFEGGDDDGENAKGPSSITLSFRNTPAFEEMTAAAGETGTAPGAPGDSAGSGKPFILRDRPDNFPGFNQNSRQGLAATPQSPGGSDAGEYIRELVFNRLPRAQATDPAPYDRNVPKFYTPQINPARPESSYINWNRNFDFDSPLSIGSSAGLLKVDINAPLLMREVMQATMRDGDIPFVLDSEGKVITVDENHLNLINDLSLEAGTYSRVDKNSGGWMISARQNPRNGRTVGILRPVSGELRAIRNTALVNSSFGIAACVLALLSIYPLSKSFTHQLGELMTGVSHLSQGNLDVRVPVTTRNEFGRLAESFNQMAVDLKHNQADMLKHEGLKKELEFSREIQKGLLPGSPMKRNRAELQGVSIPAREVGGDFFNYFPLPENQTALLIGDISGKGVPAALQMANIQAKLQA
ncbi:MAG: HAMP domain-containing protein, partial [Acidobacteriota bacterium]